MSAPVDATTTAAWRTLTGLKAGLAPDLRGWFAADPARAEAFTLTAGDLHVDLSKNLIDDAVLTAVLERVGLASWTAARGGLDARVGERGSLVSGGQAQRLALARALLADFDVLVLDEPTASVDAPVADALLADLLHAASGRTVVLIAHRVPAALTFDRRITIADGTATQSLL